MSERATNEREAGFAEWSPTNFAALHGVGTIDKKRVDYEFICQCRDTRYPSPPPHSMASKSIRRPQEFGLAGNREFAILPCFEKIDSPRIVTTFC